MLLAELVPLSNQAQYKNGAILAGGLLKIFYKGRTDYATTYNDAAGNVENPNPVILDNEGRCSVYASPDYSYTLVFCDKYGQVQFSYDKDLLDPIPVEDTYSIAIKGDETITVNKQLSGQTEVYNLHAKGEGYNGIDPIVVDNEHRNISANHVQLGVVAPLTFVEDSESATVIGFDETTLPDLVEPIVESAISSMSGEFTYSAGENIDITDHVISGKDWTPEIESATSGKQDTINWEYTTGGFISGADGSAFEGKSYSSVSGTVKISGNDLEIGCPAIKTGVPWLIGGWSHTYDDTTTSFNAGFPKHGNSYRLEHIMYYRQYPNSAHTGFSAELRQVDASNNILSSTMLYGIFDYEFIPLPNCNMIWMYCSGTPEECQRGITDYYKTGNTSSWVERLAWEEDTPTRKEFSELYQNVAGNSGTWTDGKYSIYRPWATESTSGNLVIAGSRYPRQSLVEISGENSTATAGIILPVPEQNLSATRIPVAASGSLADVSWAEFDLNSTADIANKLDTSAFSSVSGELGFYSKYHRTGYVLSGNLTIDNESPSDNLIVKISGKDNVGTPSSVEAGLILPFGGSTPVLRHAAMSSGGKVFWDPTEFATVDTVSAMIQSAASSYDMSAGANINITKDDVNSAIGIEVTGLSAYQPVGEYYSASNPSGFITAVPEGTLNESGFEYDSDNLISGYNGSAFAGQGGGGGADYSGVAPVIVDNSAREISVESYGLVAGNNISITDDSANSSTTIAVTGLDNYASTDWVQSNYYDIFDVENLLSQKQDNLTFNYTNDNKISGINNSALDSVAKINAENGLSAITESGAVRIGNTYNLTAYSGTNVLQLTDNLGLLGGVISSVNYEKEIPGSGISSTEWACSSTYWRDENYDHVDLVDSSFVNNPASSYDIDFYTVFRWSWETDNFGVDLYDITDDTTIQTLTPNFDEPNIRLHFTADDVTGINTAHDIGYRIYNYAGGYMWEAWAQGPNDGDWNPTSATISGFGGNPSTTICAVSGLTWTGGGASYTGDAQGALDEVYNNSATWNNYSGKQDSLTFTYVEI